MQRSHFAVTAHPETTKCPAAKLRAVHILTDLAQRTGSVHKGSII